MMEQPATYTWHETWKKAVSDPSRESFQVIMDDPRASINRAMLWIYPGGMIISTIFFILPLIVIASLRDSLAAQTTILLLTVGPLVGGALISLLFLGNVATIHGLSRLFGGEGKFAITAYVMASIVTPFSLINLGLLIIPAIGWAMMYVMGIYQLIVTILAIQALYDFGWGKAILIGIIPPAVLNILVILIYYVFAFSVLFAIADNPDAFFPPTPTP